MDTVPLLVDKVPIIVDTVPLLVDTVTLLVDTVDGKGFVVVLCNAKQFYTSWLCVVLADFPAVSF